MIIMPGETKTILLPIKRQADGSFGGKWKAGDPPLESQGWSLQEVPPPLAAPVQNRAKELGLPDGLRVEASRCGQWRCSNCRGMQPSGVDEVWVPDSVRADDPAWSVTEACRQNAYNGHLSAWCVPCARRLGGSLRSVAKQLCNQPQITAANAAQFNYFPVVFGAAMLIAGSIAIWMALAHG